MCVLFLNFSQLLLAAAVCDRHLHLSSTFNKLPSLLSILKRSTKPEAKEILKSLTSSEVTVKEEQMETESDHCCDQLNLLFSKNSSEVQQSFSLVGLPLVLHEQN
jgi:hypothetical protein